MRRKSWAIASSVGLVASLGSLVAVAPGGADAATGRVALAGTHDAVAVPSKQAAAVPATSRIDFQVSLQPRDLAGAESLAKAVSDPTSSAYRHYDTPAQWEARYSPTAAAVRSTEAWLRSQHLAAGDVSADRMTIHVSGTVSHIEKAFGFGINEYRVNGRMVRLASTTASIPATLSGVLGGIEGVNETINTNDSTNGQAASAAKTTAKGIPLPPGFRNPQQCSKYYGQRTDLKAPAYGDGYPDPSPETICGYTPKDLATAYGLDAGYAKGFTGKGVTVAIVDAYASPTLLKDAQEYASRNDAAYPMLSSQFSESLPSSFNDETACSASGWFGEQTLDVEAVHAMAPGAHILYVGARNCEEGLYNSVQQIVDNHSASIITDSWGDDAGDLLSAGNAAFDNVLIMADATGVGVQFSAGDSGDEFTTTGLTSADYPAVSPYSTAVGGTSVAIGGQGQQLFQVGWSTSKSYLCSPLLYGAIPGCEASTDNTWVPSAPGAYVYGGGGGTSYNYPEPYYQRGVVPKALADRNSAVTERANRVEPDISMDADPTTGFLMGETQVFPNGTYYAQFKEGGTSLASPLFAGVMAIADQEAGGSLGFVNPVLYRTDSKDPAAFEDIVSHGKLADTRVDYANEVNNSSGYLVSTRTLDYQGVEEYCDGTGSCETRDTALTLAPGFDSMTGIGSISPSFASVIAGP